MFVLLHRTWKFSIILRKLYPFGPLINRFSTICECWHENPEKRPQFHDLVQQVSITLEAETDYVDFSGSLQPKSQSETGMIESQCCIEENEVYILQGDIQEEEEHQYDTVM